MSKKVVSASNEEKILLDLDNLGLFNTSNPAEMLVLSPLEGLGHFYGVVTAEGPSKVATIKLNESARPHSHRLSELAAQRKQKFTAHLSLRGIGVSVVNRMPLELVYVSMSDISMDYEDNMREQCFDFSIGHLQVDNQSFMTQFPVLLHTRPKREKFLSVSLKRSADYASVHYIKRLSLFVDDMDVCMDDSVFLKMWDFVANVARSLDMETSSSPDVSAAAASVGVSSSLTPQFAIPTHNFKSRQIYLQELTLSGTNLLVSFINTDDTADGQLGETAVSRIIRTYGALANIERAPVKLEPLVLSLQFLGREDLMDTLKTHYVTGVRRGLAKILASADFLGAPMALAGHVREGWACFGASLFR
jgi:vacuolar protein sorting-associated protein 13A/C